MTDLVIALFVTVLVVVALYVPRLGDALGRRVRGGSPAERAGGDDRNPPAA